MGSVISKPKAPKQQVVYVPGPPAPAPETTPTAADAPATPTPGQQRVNNLLLRDRGIFGTAVTGFRGLLALANQSQPQPRKTLLGE